MMTLESDFRGVESGINHRVESLFARTQTRVDRFRLRTDRFTSRVALAILFLSGCASAGSVTTPSGTPRTYMEGTLARFIDTCTSEDCGFRLDPGASVDSFQVAPGGASVDVYFNDAFAQVPFREDMLARLRTYIHHHSDGDYTPELNLFALGVRAEDLIPNVFRRALPIDSGRLPVPGTETAPAGHGAAVNHPLAINLSKPFRPVRGLWGNHIAIWPSHGWYFERKLDRWEWQRARLFQTVEDLLPMAFVAPYLTPMLERAGASVYMPRERDPQPNQAIVDNDARSVETGQRYLEIAESEFAWSSSEGRGFGPSMSPLEDGENPFQHGSIRHTRSDSTISAQAIWIPDIPESGRYAVYVSYANVEGATSDAHYTVWHLGGKTEFSVDQRMGGATWEYLGSFLFASGVHPDEGQVTLTNESETPGRALSADAVRFGGGMGSIRRGRRTSGRPRYAEGARYYMQFSGMPKELVYNVTESPNDYVDDYRGRAEWVNYLRGAPFGPNKNRSNVGLHIPIDLSLAFHTDAGITDDDSTIGTLMIYSSTGAEDKRVFPDGMSRFANRDLGDIMQTQIVSDLHVLFDSGWTRRSIWDRDYSEAVRPNVPGVLLELLSHQSFSDMKFGLDPSFRFTVARAIYKSMLRFLAFQGGRPYVVEPLRPDHFSARFDSEGRVVLSWAPAGDPLEPSADPDGYVVYSRMEGRDFDNGIYVERPRFTAPAPPTGQVVSFRVTAVNEGGESRPSEILSVGHSGSQDPPVLIVNGFDRVAAPGVIETGKYQGFSALVDEGVPDGYDAGFVGDQYDFDTDSPWFDDDAPGHGASFSTYETRVLPGNTLDYAVVHGVALMASGHSFVSSSDESVEEGGVRLDEYPVVDLILGEERTTRGPGNLAAERFKTFSGPLQMALRNYSYAGGRLLVSGAYVGTDMAGTAAGKSFLEDVLGVTWRTDHASQRGGVYASSDILLPFGTELEYSTQRAGAMYRVESPDAIEPADSNAVTFLRFKDGNMSAGVASGGSRRVITLGFPFETVRGRGNRSRLMREIMDYLYR